MMGPSVMQCRTTQELSNYNCQVIEQRCIIMVTGDGPTLRPLQQRIVVRT